MTKNDRLALIDQELRRCMQELRMASAKQLNSTAFDDDPTVSVTQAKYVDEDIDLDSLSATQSCLSADLYRLGRINDFQIYTKQKNLYYNDEMYRAVIHSTNNKMNEIKVCAISLFNSRNQFVAYLFTTNDPLAFDNFNCFRGDTAFCKAPTGKCVEQMVFCESKVRLAQQFLQNQTQDTLMAYVLDPNNKISTELIGELMHSNADLMTIMSEDRNFISEQTRNYIGRSYTPEEFYQTYTTFLENCLKKPNHLTPENNYKNVGRMVILSQAELDEWRQIAMMCALSARMEQLSSNRHERSLAAAMTPLCVIECSRFDDLWAYKIPRDKDMAWFLEEDGKTEMQRIWKDAYSYQHDFIENLNAAYIDDNSEKACKLLFNPQNQRLLGLSECILQAAWTGTLQLSDSTINIITERLATNGITFHWYCPALKQSKHTAYQVASAIGKPMDSLQTRFNKGTSPGAAFGFTHRDIYH